MNTDLLKQGGKIPEEGFDVTIAALNAASDRLARECSASGGRAHDSVWMEIQVIGNVVTAMYRDFYKAALTSEAVPGFHTCPVCDYRYMPHPPSGYNICAQCGTEFDLDDEMHTIEELRAKWIAGGCKFWFSEKRSERVQESQNKLPEAVQPAGEMPERPAHLSAMLALLEEQTDGANNVPLHPRFASELVKAVRKERASLLSENASLRTQLDSKGTA